MLYSIIRSIARCLLFLLNGKTAIYNKHNLPNKEQGYILISPHRSWLDPVYLALAASPKQFCFMAKKELFKNPLLRWLIKSMNAFPVDRENPGPSAIKIPVTHLKEGKLGLIMFPSGTRHSQESKQGAAMIARLAKVPIVPAVYHGPFTFKNLLKRHKTHVLFGEPIYMNTKEDQLQFPDLIKQQFEKLDYEMSKKIK
ncbi:MULTISPECIES: 1-acyl-sn-glycerol-3-phosphate acyltransferase [unclassified Granulicatella]|uniref:lysophospholipid acyltransferase family protein n=1 Tax=unclassified Granulicatella TaxID=2630493 RepID=UPI0010731907|nr:MULTISPECIES: 1-acyl-sn-glycerol-3-phosphate acyltransferase [unclassified Granulicatella]MBF0780027.1 1-acyl-sn-glycerol-3-phosphate acyltransferase [Granulicatella sp. 19428wC4_WM01]TFU95877.1 1-acyl-sn-glycerol-3-phosphate acyltransferase [Granulicatella sp. WM01]